MGDFMTRFYSALGMPSQRRVAELTYLIDTGPNKELQTIFPELINSIFGGGVTPGWRLRQITDREDDFELISNFLVPQGPMFRLCYKLLADSQLKYSFPIHLLPSHIYEMIQRGQYAQFYEDLLNIDPQTMHLESLYLNPFDYYIFHFAVYLLNGAVGKTSWEKYDTVYLGLVGDYLTHFLPTDPNKPVLPYLPYYTGKAAALSSLQTNNRTVHTSSLWLCQDMPGLGGQMNNNVQPQPRNETWRSETVLQVLIDVWLSTDFEQCQQFNMFSNNLQSQTLRASILPASAAERVRIARMVVKQVHAFSGTDHLDPIPNFALLRRSARRLLRAHVYVYVFSLVRSWPLDASFRLVMELWLSYIQPWRYATDLNSSADVDSNENSKTKLVDMSYMDFIADNLPAYTTIFQNVIPRFLRMDLTAPKNIVMLYRLSKVFAQQNLVPLLSEVEVSVISGISSEGRVSPQSSPNSSIDTSSKRWNAIAKQAIADFKQTNDYRALWGSECRELVLELMTRLQQARLAAQANIHDTEERIKKQSAGFFNSVWSLFSISDDEFNIDEQRKVLMYLNSTIQQFAHVFNLEDSFLVSEPSIASTSGVSQSTFSTSLATMSPQQAQSRSSTIKYMGDTELIPIGTHENTFLVRMFYQLSKWLNDNYSEEMNEMWQQSDLLGYMSREVLSGPCTVQYYAKPGGLQARRLGPRISLRGLAGHALLLWLFAGYTLCWLFGYAAVTYILFIVFLWCTKVFLKACAKKIGLMADTIHQHED